MNVKLLFISLITTFLVHYADPLAIMNAKVVHAILLIRFLHIQTKYSIICLCFNPKAQ